MDASGLDLVMPLTIPDAALCEDRDSLVARLKGGSVDALGEAYDQHQGAVRAFARRLIGSEDEAEDLVHETFLSLPGALRGYRGMSSVRTFLISIAANHARHYVRAAARRRAAMGRLVVEPAASPDSPEDRVREQELARALTRSLDELPLDQRIAFVLCEVEERSSADVALIVGAPEATVRTRLFHARQKLRAALAREGFR